MRALATRGELAGQHLRAFSSGWYLKQIFLAHKYTRAPRDAGLVEHGQRGLAAPDIISTAGVVITTAATTTAIINCIIIFTATTVAATAAPTATALLPLLLNY